MLPYANRIKQQLKHLTGVTKNLKKMKEKLEQKKIKFGSKKNQEPKGRKQQ